MAICWGNLKSNTWHTPCYSTIDRKTKARSQGEKVGNLKNETNKQSKIGISNRRVLHQQ